MPALFFPTVNALRLVLSSGSVPAAVCRSPAQGVIDDNQRIWIELSELPWDCLPALARLGVQALGGAGLPTRPVGSWAELLPLRPGSSSAERFLVRLAERDLPRFVARLRRHSHEWGVMLGDPENPGNAWVLAKHVPADILAEAAERDAPLEIFTEDVPGVWVRWGWQHPLPEQLVVPAGRVLLLSPPCVVTARQLDLPDLEPDEYRLRRVNCPSRPPPPEWPRVPVRFTLVPNAAPGQPRLWVIAAAYREEFWKVVAAADSRELEKLEIAPPADPQAELLIRAKGKQPTFLPVQAQAFAADDRINGLYLPVDRTLKPVIRPHELARILGIEPGTLIRLQTDPAGRVVSHRLRESAFRPLADCLEYVAPARQVLATVARQEPFALARFTVEKEPAAVEEPEPLPTPPPPEAPMTPPHEPEQTGWLRRSLGRIFELFRGGTVGCQVQAGLIGQPPAVEPPTRPSVRVEKKLTSSEALVHGHDWTARRRQFEDRLFRELPRLKPAERATAWAELAGVYAVVGNPLDSAVCWTNAVWETPSPPQDWLRNWLLAECRAAKLPEDVKGIERWLSEPVRPGVGRVIAAYTVWAASCPVSPPEFLAALPRLIAFLEHHFDDIPIRATWLSRLALAKACGGDVLGLARWRDRVLNRLDDHGPGLDLDEPSFLRFHGTPGADRFPAAREWLLRVREQAVKWVQDHGRGTRLRFVGLDAESEATAAYAQFMFAWGLGCLGERTKARDWAARSRKVLGRASGPGVVPATHALLADLFQLRIREVQEGRKAVSGLPPDIRHRLAALPELARFAVDRLREHSRILEPVDRVRPFRGLELKVFWGHDRLGERLFVFAERSEPADLPGEAESLLQTCTDRPTTDTLPRIVLTLLELAPGLPEPLFVRTFELLPTAVEWLEPLLATQPWRAEEVPRKAVEYAARMIAAGYETAARLPTEVVANAVSLVTRQLLALGNFIREPLLRSGEAVFRSLDRLGLRGEAERLVRFLDLGGYDPVPTPEQTGLAIGWYVAGDEDSGNRILNRVRDALYLTETPGKTPRAIAYAAALGFAPPGIAHGRLEELFQRLDRVETRGSTNPYFTLKPLHLIDTVVRSIVSDNHTLVAAVRSWLDDDEFLIRSRIHRDLTRVFRDAGIS
jgi:hypothetical protein